MAFQIEKDHIADEEVDRSGRLFEGPFVVRWGALTEEMILPKTDDALKELPKVQFRLFDDDGELYYEGWLHDDWEAKNQQAALQWAESDSGCTTIKVKRGEEWKLEIG